MCLKYFEGGFDEADSVDATQWRTGLDFNELIGSLRAQVGSFEYSPALQRVWRDVVDSGNRFIQETEPFKLAKTDLAACRVVLVNLADWMRIAAILIKPFLPRTALTFYQAFNFESTKAWDDVKYDDAVVPHLPRDLRDRAPISNGKPAPLFPKIELR